MARARIYTKTGDTGKTRLWDGTQVDKNDPRIETNGALDELNSALGLARSLAPACMKEEIGRLQDLLMTLMAYVARGEKPLEAPEPELLEAWIDRLLDEYPMGGKFVNPGESPAGGALHLARTIARRAERVALPLRENGNYIEPRAYQYVNRLSDLLYALAHKADEETRIERLTREVMRRVAGADCVPGGLNEDDTAIADAAVVILEKNEGKGR